MQTAENIIKTTDEGLYEAKRNGRNRMKKFWAM
jgi:PleD family two-component response regulator